MSEEIKNIKASDSIELRSEEVQEILGRPPKWIIRWGISILFIIMAILLIGSMFFKYPDIITSEVTITTEHPAVWITARSTGKLQRLFVTDGQTVQENELLALIENPADYNDIKQLKQYTSSISPFFNDYDIEHIYLLSTKLRLGSLQDIFAQFYTSTQDYIHFFNQQYHQKKIASAQQELKGYNLYLNNLKGQEELQEENLTLLQKQFDRDKKLYTQKAISLLEYENSEKLLLQAKQSLQQAKLSISNTDITIDKLKQTITEFELDYVEKSKTVTTALKTSYDILTAHLTAWERDYLLQATSTGTITFAKVWSENQQITLGDKVFGIVATNQGEIIGKVQLPSAGAGKVKVGQRVNIKLDGYPYMEFGMLPASVESISLIPNEKLYTVQLIIPKDLRTFYGTQIEFTGEMTGSAEIATEEMSLFRRLLNPLKYFYKRNT